MWHGKERERTYRPRVQIIMEEDWRHSNPTTRIHSQQVLKKKGRRRVVSQLEIFILEEVFCGSLIFMKRG